MGYETLALATIRQNVFANLYTLINTNKPSGWNVLAKFPEDEASFPCIVIDSANVKPTIVTMDGDGSIVEDIDAQIDFYAKVTSGDEMIDVGRDNVMNTFLTNETTLETYKLYLQEDAFDDSTTDIFVVGKQKVRTGSSIVKMGMI